MFNMIRLQFHLGHLISNKPFLIVATISISLKLSAFEQIQKTQKSEKTNTLNRLEKKNLSLNGE
jgi:hypothetical protein